MAFRERNERIMERVAAHYVKAVEHYGEDNVLGVFLYGSQNYNCDLVDSDVDTKCILISDLYHLTVNPYKTNHLHLYRDDREEPEVCECMTIQHMVANWKKQNPNFLEIMFTSFFIINPIYREEWDNFIVKEGYRELIARYDVRGGILSIAHQAINTIHKKPMDGKKIGNAARLFRLLKNYTSGVDYAHCLSWQVDSAMIRELKAGTREVLSTDAGVLLTQFEWFIEDADKYPGPCRELDTPLNNFIVRLHEIRLGLD
jgi:hypothetical protein